MAEYNLGRVVGLSAYELAVESGYEGTESEWLESLRLHYSDLTDVEILTLQKPASDIAEEVAVAEVLRASAETSRVTAETARVDVEASRVSAETSRVELYNTVDTKIAGKLNVS